MLVTTALSILFGLVIAPVSWEWLRAAKVARQTAELQANGAYVIHRSQPATWAAQAAHFLGMGRFSYLGKEIVTVDCGDANWDLAKIPVIETLEEIHFRHRDVTCSDPNYRQPSVRLVQYENSYPKSGLTTRDPRLLQHFPNVETARLMGLHANAALLQDLTACQRLKRLELHLHHQLRETWVPQPAPWDGKPVSNLKQLEVLHVDGTSLPVDWSFLATMPELREIRATGCNISWSDSKTNLPRDRDEARQRTPLHYAAQLPKLNWLNLRYAASYSEDLAALGQNTQIRKLKLDALPDGPTSLAGLRAAENLRSLHLEFKQFKTAAQVAQVEAELLQLPQLREFSSSYDPLTRQHVDLLLQLKQVEAFKMIRIDEYSLKDKDLALLLPLRIDVFPKYSNLDSGRKLFARTDEGIARGY